jgi:tripeptide aminopeptidase
VKQVEGLVREGETRPWVNISLKQIGSRPAGQLSRSAPLIQWAAEALHHVGYPHPQYTTSSTDANIPLSLGYNAVCIGIGQGKNVHRLDEQFDPAYLGQGLGQTLLLTLTAAES